MDSDKQNLESYKELLGLLEKLTEIRASMDAEKASCLPDEYRRRGVSDDRFCEWHEEHLEYGKKTDTELESSYLFFELRDAAQPLLKAIREHPAWVNFYEMKGMFDEFQQLSTPKKSADVVEPDNECPF